MNDGCDGLAEAAVAGLAVLTAFFLAGTATGAGTETAATGASTGADILSLLLVD